MEPGRSDRLAADRLHREGITALEVARAHNKPNLFISIVLHEDSVRGPVRPDGVPTPELGRGRLNTDAAPDKQ